jgi:hypothetical protein
MIALNDDAPGSPSTAPTGLAKLLTYAAVGFALYVAFIREDPKPKYGRGK